MPQSRSSGLLAFLLALPALALVVPPESQAAAVAAPEAGAAQPPGAAAIPGEAMEARLQRLSEAIRARSGSLEPGQQGVSAAGEPWLVAGAWGNGGGRGGWGNGGGRGGWGNGGRGAWGNGGRAWGNGAYGNSFIVRPGPVWANFQPGWNNFRNGPSFLNW